MSTTRTLLATALLATAALTLIPTAAQARTACDPNLEAPKGSLIGDYWRSKNGPTSAYGCPTTPEYGYPDKRGSWQLFKAGKIVWSPNFGPGALLKVWRKTGAAHFAWHGAGNDWDYFNIMWKPAGRNWAQGEVKRTDPWTGSTSLDRSYFVPDNDENGTIRINFKVQGCDRGEFPTYRANCGPWSYPIALDYLY
jgi:hypothetical protein